MLERQSSDRTYSLLSAQDFRPVWIVWILKNCIVSNMREKGVNRQSLAHPLLVAAATNPISVNNPDLLALYC